MARETLSRKAKTAAKEGLKNVKEAETTTKPKAKKKAEKKVEKTVKETVKKAKKPAPPKAKAKAAKTAAVEAGADEDANGDGEEADEADESDMADESWKTATSVYDFTVKNIKGEDVPLSTYKGQVLVIVNVASKCGYTSKHYKELTELDEKFKDKGLRILAFPCNQFGGQEPGTPEQICEFTKKKNVNFDLFEKVNVNGDNAHPLWKYLKEKQGGTLVDAIKWNFTKFIVDKNGIPVERHAANASPSSLIPNIEKYL